MVEESTTATTTSPENGSEERTGRRALPAVTLALCGVNLLFWLVIVAVGGAPGIGGLIWGDEGLPALLAFGAKANTLIQAGEYWRLVSALFLHLNFLHLAVGTYTLLLFGGFIEQLYGRRRLLILYVMAGVCGNAVSYLMNPRPSLGSAPAIFGLFGAVVVFWWKHRAGMAPEFWQRLGNQVFGFLFVNLMLAVVYPPIDNWGYIGGFFGGILVASFAQSRLSDGEDRESEWLPVPLALVTVVAMLGYAAFEMARSPWGRHRPLLTSQAAISRGDARGVAAALRPVVARHPEILDLRLRLAHALSRSGEWREAASVLKDGMRRHPNEPLLLLALAPVLGQGQDWAGLASLTERLLRIRPEDPDLLLMHASTLHKAGQGEEAESIYRRLLRDNPKQAGLQNDLAYLYADNLNRNLDEALTLARRATEAEPKNGSFWDTLGWVYFRLGRQDDAFAAMREAVILEPKNAEVRYHMGAVYQARGDRAGALREYREALRLDRRLSDATRALQRLERP